MRTRARLAPGANAHSSTRPESTSGAVVPDTTSNTSSGIGPVRYAWWNLAQRLGQAATDGPVCATGGGVGTPARTHARH